MPSQATPEIAVNAASKVEWQRSPENMCGWGLHYRIRRALSVVWQASAWGLF